jgi:hypothetical protein
MAAAKIHRLSATSASPDASAARQRSSAPRHKKKRKIKAVRTRRGGFFFAGASGTKALHCATEYFLTAAPAGA